MMVYETENDIIVIDTGFMLPKADMPGVDLILPDIHYLVERQEKIRGILLTHGHEDHIGALFYVLRQLDVPVYGTQLTSGDCQREITRIRCSQQGTAQYDCPRRYSGIG